MSFLNLKWRILALVAVVVTGPVATGQTYHPFADPMDYDPDWQFFAPVDVESLTELSPRKRASTGFFGTYDRTYIWMSRPEHEDSKSQGDFGWGNRFDFGFMTDEDHGWLFSLRHMGGPTSFNTLIHERLDRVNTADTGDPLNPVVPFFDANDPFLGFRAYRARQSLNVASLSNFEINKTWRREPYRYGGILEPLVGFKYSNLRDRAIREEYVIVNPTTEQFITNHRVTDNHMFGGQLGARYFTHYNRWTLSGEFRAFGMANFQSSDLSTRNFQTQYGTGATPGAVTSNTIQAGTGFVSNSNEEFVFGFEARAQAAYQVTRSFNLRFGLDVVNFAKGIWRGNTQGGLPGQIQDQDVQAAGVTFGLSLNR
ncbi:MAG TPA: hypothetical protein DDW52_08120 [Planctomycetaceae bacterium]|nr:hypothetical protein [Planctomycetaceae bacterium]